MIRVLRHRRSRVVGAIVSIVAASAVAVTMATAVSAHPAKVVAHAAGACGTLPTFPPIDSSQGELKSLPKSIQAYYNDFPDPVLKSPWATFKGDPKPWKIGVSAGFPIDGAEMADTISEMQREFAIAKSKGLTTGSLDVNVPVSTATTTPADQIAAIQTMVQQGVKGIILFPASGAALASVITQDGKKGVVFEADTQALPQSPYAVGVVWQSYIQPIQGMINAMGGKGTLLDVRGIAGVPEDDATNQELQRQVAQCPNIKIVGVVRGNYDNAVTKTVVAQFLASHPGPIDGVFNAGEMAPGIIRAFIAAGRPVPPMGIVYADAAVAGWWLQNPKYQAVASVSNGPQGTYAMFHVMLRILNGNELKVNDIVKPSQLMTAATVKQFAPPGATINSTAETRNALNGWINDAYLNYFFVKPGAPGGDIGR